MTPTADIYLINERKASCVCATRISGSIAARSHADRSNALYQGHQIASFFGSEYVTHMKTRMGQIKAGNRSILTPDIKNGTRTTISLNLQTSQHVSRDKSEPRTHCVYGALILWDGEHRLALLQHAIRYLK